VRRARPMSSLYGMPSPRRWSHFHAPLYSFYRESLRTYTGWCINEFTAGG
jgi:hypothetical protein